VIVRLIVVVCEVVPLLPVMVMVRVPVVARLVAEIFKVEVPEPVMEVGLKARVVPLPAPVAESATAELNPPAPVTVTVTLPEPLLATESDVGLALTEKVGLVPVTVSDTVVVSTVLPEVPVTVIG
jgi:hypothetical protein